MPFLHTQTAQTTSTSTVSSHVPDVLREVLPGILRDVLPGIFREVLLEAREANTVVFKKTHAHPQQGEPEEETIETKIRRAFDVANKKVYCPVSVPPVPQYIKVHPSCALPFRCVVTWPPLKAVLATLNTSTEHTVVTYVGLWRYS